MAGSKLRMKSVVRTPDPKEFFVLIFIDIGVCVCCVGDMDALFCVCVCVSGFVSHLSALTNSLVLCA